MFLIIKLRKLTVLFALLLFIGAAFSLPDMFSYTASAPSGSSEAAADIGPVAGPDIETPIGPVDEAPPEPLPETPDSNGFVTVRMDASDVFQGSLILINHEHSHEIPDEHGFVAISELKTPSYRVTRDSMLLSPSVIGPLNDMMDAFYAETGSNSVTVISAFRDYEKQQEALNDYIRLVGYNEALRWAASPGHSEHQAGLAVDFGVYSGGALRTFLGTGTNAWIPRNAYKYGFILRYPDSKADITGTAHEPWHFRYVGVPHAFVIYESGLCFEEYIEFLSGYTRDEPFHIFYESLEYEVYFTEDLNILVPFDCEFDISGNNINGFIVTIGVRES